MSWFLNYNQGGWRLGSINGHNGIDLSNNDDYYKVIYQVI